MQATPDDLGFQGIVCTLKGRSEVLLILIGVDLRVSQRQRNAFFPDFVSLFGKNITFALKIGKHEETFETYFLSAGTGIVAWFMRFVEVAGHAQGGAADGEDGETIGEEL